MNAAPGASYEAVLAAGVTGLTGTVALGLLDNKGGIVEPLSAAAIIETPAGSGVYAATRISPDSEGQYTLLWSMDGTTAPEQLSIDDLVVTSSAPADPVPPADLYTTVEELFRVLKIRSPTPEQTTAAQRILATAAGEINTKMGRLEDLSAWEIQLCATVNLERGEELWQEEESPWGVIGLGTESGPVFTSRNSRALAKLTRVQQSWGVA